MEAPAMAWDDNALKTAQKFATVLLKTQSYSADRMQAYQRSLLERLVRHARAEVPFYRTRLDPLFGPDDAIRWEAWTDVPTITRFEAQQAGEALFARSTPTETGGFVEDSTSGSTGMPLQSRTSQIMHLMSASISQRLLEWHKINMDDSIAVILDEKKQFPYPDGRDGDTWNLTRPQAPAYNLSIGYTTAQQVEWLVRKQPNILYTYPRNAQAITEAFQTEKIVPPFHTIIVHGEILEEETSQIIEGAGIRLIDRYGAVEIGPFSGQCPHGSWQHQYSEVSLMETIAPDTGAIITEGRGALVATPFYNYAMPLIRYQNGDLLERSTQPCPCGATLPRIDRILGRERNMLTFSDGTQIWPNILRSEYDKYLSVRQFQFIQHTPTRLEMRYVPGDPARPVDKAGLTSMMQRVLHPDITVELTPLSTLPRAPSGKFETWISHVKPQDLAS
jgi:phenylacetate-CoA ligase